MCAWWTTSFEHGDTKVGKGEKSLHEKDFRLFRTKESNLDNKRERIGNKNR